MHHNPIKKLRSELNNIESASNFNGKPYPDPLVSFPWELTGRGFFPGGDGLWRDPNPSSVIGPSTYPFPFNGIMFVGQDFGSIDKYPPKNRAWELDNVATWKFLVERIKQSGIPGEMSFFTNALLGLRKEGSTIGQNPCISMPLYVEICRNFLAMQIKIQDPKLIVVFRSVSTLAYSPLFKNIRAVDNSNIKITNCCDRDRVVLITQHPSSDYGVITKYPEKFQARCDDLATAWCIANSL